MIVLVLLSPTIETTLSDFRMHVKTLLFGFSVAKLNVTRI